MSFSINDYVRVKAGVTLVETGEPVPGWVGRVEKITPNGFILLELDAQSLERLPPKFLEQCIVEDEPPLGYYFSEQDLEPATRRDTDEELEADTTTCSMRRPYKKPPSNTVRKSSKTPWTPPIGVWPKA